MQRVIHLHGRLARHGERFSLDVASPAEAVRAIGCQVKGFYADVREGAYRVIRGDLKTGLAIGEDELALGFGRTADLHIVPVPEGGKSGGLGKIILGVVMIGAAIAFAPAGAGLLGANLAASTGVLGLSFGNVAAFGLSMALAGVSQMLTPVQEVESYTAQEAPDQRPSHIFNGAVNNAEQGSTIPIVYGRFMAGTVVASAALEIGRI